MKRSLPLLVLMVLLIGCRSGTAPQELAELRARTSTLEAENAHLQGQLSLSQAERDQLRAQNDSLATDLAKAQAGVGAAQAGAAGDANVAVSDNLVVMPREVRPGEWVAVNLRNYPVRLLPQAGVALRGKDNANLTEVPKLASANILILPIPHTAAPGTYQVVLGQTGAMGPGGKIDDRVAIVVKAP